MTFKRRKRRKRGSRYHRGTHVSSLTGESYKFRSAWEQKVMIYLDTCPYVESWTYEKTVIEYISNIRTKKVRKYYPDFFVKYKSGLVEIIEVKPKRKLEQLTVKKKSDAAHRWCKENGMTYRIFTEIELKDIGIL